MDDGTDNPKAVKVEGHSQCIILTYFQGDIGSMVDAHFSRALSTHCKAKAPALKAKKTRKSIKLEDINPCQGATAEPYTEPQVPPMANQRLTFNPAEDPTAPWHSFPARPGEGTGMPPLAYSLSSDGLSLTGQEYATSLLNLLHSDRSEMGPSVASSSKPELLPGWTVPQGFRDSVDPTVGFEAGRRLDKKDLYWY